MNTTKTKTAPTERIVRSMLLENTGAHFLDSGGAYGRAHERNQGRDFRAEKPVTLAVDDSGISVSINTFHFLVNALEYNAKLNRRFVRFCNRKENLDTSWPQLCEDFVAKRVKDAHGIYGEGEVFGVNTYNHESLVDQVLQYCYWTDDDGPHVLLQVHGGCDVRGGYTAPRGFDVNDDTAILNDHEAEVYCTARQAAKKQRAVQQTLGLDHDAGDEPLCDATWTTDDGYHWYRDGVCGYGAGRQLKTYDRVELEDDQDPGLMVQERKDKGLEPVLFHRDGTGFCPDCGAALAPFRHQDY